MFGVPLPFCYLFLRYRLTVTKTIAINKTPIKIKASLNPCKLEMEDNQPIRNATITIKAKEPKISKAFLKESERSLNIPIIYPLTKPD